MDSPVVTVEMSMGDWRMPFSEEVKYIILGVALTLFLVALGLLAWQSYRCCSQGSEDAETIYPPDIHGLNFMVEDLHKEAQRHSRCPSRDSSLSDLDGSAELNGLVDQEEELEEEIKGSLLFSLFYDRQQSLLVVTVLEARGLPMRDFSGTVDPFVYVRVLWAGREEARGGRRPLQCVVEEWKSRTVKDSDSPVFGEQFSCSLEEGEVAHITVRLEVRDFDKFSRHGILGEVRVPLSDMKLSYPLEMLKDLKPFRKDVVGELLLSLKYLPTSQRLEVGLLKIKTLSKFIASSKVMYARTSVVCNQTKLRHWKTTQKAHREVTVFNEVMTFTLPNQPISECSIAVSVYELPAGKKLSKRLIGQVTVAKRRSSEDDHWSLMMKTIRQPIAKWHMLLI